MTSPTYIHQRADWPRFRWDDAAVLPLLMGVDAHRRRLLAAVEGLGFEARQRTTLANIVLDVQKSSEIEGERLDEAQIRSSVARRLGMDVAGLPEASRDVEGIVAVTLDATQNAAAPLTTARR